MKRRRFSRETEFDAWYKKISWCSSSICVVHRTPKKKLSTKLIHRWMLLNGKKGNLRRLKGSDAFLSLTSDAIGCIVPSHSESNWQAITTLPSLIYKRQKLLCADKFAVKYLLDHLILAAFCGQFCVIESLERLSIEGENSKELRPD